MPIEIVEEDAINTLVKMVSVLLGLVAEEFL